MVLTLMKSEEDRQELKSNFCHWVWIDDPDESLCGKDMSNHNWVSDEVAVDCPECLWTEEFLEQIENNLGGE